jgi:cyclase
MEDIRCVISKYRIIGAAAGSLFVFKGKFRAVLINYPNTAEKKAITNLSDETNHPIF